MQNNFAIVPDLLTTRFLRRFVWDVAVRAAATVLLGSAGLLAFGTLAQRSLKGCDQAAYSIDNPPPNCSIFRFLPDQVAGQMVYRYCDLAPGDGLAGWSF